MIRIMITLVLLGLLTCPALAQTRCGISERIILENTTNAPVTHSFARGSHEGFVILLPGQTVTIDVVWCE